LEPNVRKFKKEKSQIETKSLLMAFKVPFNLPKKKKEACQKEAQKELN